MLLHGLVFTLVSVLAASVALAYIRYLHTRHYPPELRAPDKIHGFAYTPFRPGQAPEKSYPSLDEIRQDLAIISQLSNRVRTYSVDGSQADIPMLAAEFGMEVILGVWIGTDLAINDREVERAIEVIRSSPNVKGVLVGNETLFRHDVTEEQLIAYIVRIRTSVDVPISASEQWHIWEEHPILAKHVDMISTHILPYWESALYNDSLHLVLDRIVHLERLYPGKPVVLGEVGWPSQGRHPGNGSITAPGHQAVHIRMLVEQLNRVGRSYFVMEAFDQRWKTEEGEIGQHWGVFDAKRQPKFAFTGPVVIKLQWRGLFYKLIDGSRLSAAEWFMLGAVAILAACALIAFGYARTDQYGSVFGAALSLTWVLQLFLGLITEMHELAEQAWTPERRRMFLPWRAPIGHFPKVCIHVPCYNEPPEMVKQTLNALAHLDYRDYEVMVIDNNTVDPAIWQPIQAHVATLGPRFHFFHVAPLEGYKSGALNYLLDRTGIDVHVVAIIDSDYIVDRQWLKHLVPHFIDPTIAVIQAPQDYRDSEESSFKDFCFSEYQGFFNVGMILRNDHNAIIQHGTMTMIRREVLAHLRWDESCICEDAEFGLRVVEHGHATAYVHRSYGKGLIPDSFAAFKKQRYRWAYGAMQIIKQHARSLLLGRGTKLNIRQRYHFVVGWLPWVFESMNLFWTIFTLLWSLAMLATSQVAALPWIFTLTPIMVLLSRASKMMHLRRRLPEDKFKDAIRSVTAGSAVYHTIAKAVFFGLVTRRIPFTRTPKNIERPRLWHALVEAREELTILLLLWSGAIAIGITHDLRSLDNACWIAMLLAQSVPYQASLLMAVLSARPKPAIVMTPDMEQQRSDA
ncbi:glycosyltransferase [Dyella sp. GSA-30]|uniref:glycosyltransferase n=1 Tax=Dyella sp. GSA-30 TaxID=2994496 RepID=UPI0024933A0D|nr:glycosyltransferase [Dyella sp. GSA-30]